jgi:hypothetical protein
MTYTISAEQSAELAEQWLRKTKGLNLKAAGPGILTLGDPNSHFNKTDVWGVFFNIDEPGLRCTSLDHMILYVDAETGEVWQFYPFNVVADDEDDEE